MVEILDIEPIRAAARDWLLAIHGVHAVGIGPKLVGGVRTGVPAIIIYVVKKRLLAEVPLEQRIPPEIEGVKTDVIQSDIPKLHADTSGYSTLRGGIQLWGGATSGAGTLGCIGYFPNEAIPRVVGLTCWHVVGIRPGVEAEFSVLNTAPTTIAFSGSSAQPAGAFAVVELLVQAGSTTPRVLEIYVQSKRGDTLATLAARLASNINALSHPAVSASSDDRVVTLIPGAGGTFSQVVHVGEEYNVYGALASDTGVSLHAEVAENVITLSGSVSGDDYGIYTSFNVGGFPAPSQGVFTAIKKDTALSAIATALATTLSNLVVGVTAAASGNQVSVSSVQTLTCVTWKDIRVGQPDADFSTCCSDRIGRVAAARHDVDAALVQLDPNEKYVAEIQDIGFITGTRNVTPADIMGGFKVQKRGRTTTRTHGNIQSVNVDGITVQPIPVESGPAADYFYRRYFGGMKIAPEDPVPFSDEGDSGAAIVAVGTNTREIVGMLFSGSSDHTTATPIQPILDAFGVSIKTATAADQVQVVPAGATAQSTSPRAAAMPDPGVIRTRLREAELEVSTTPTGAALVQMIRRHAREARALVNENRRVGVAWQRHGGPTLVAAFLRSLRTGEALPRELHGLPLEVGLHRLADGFRAHASGAFVADLESFVSRAGVWSGKTYADVLDEFRRPNAVDRAGGPSVLSTFE